MYNLIMMSRKSGLDDSNRTVVHSQHGELWPRDFNVKKDHNIVLYISKNVLMCMETNHTKTRPKQNDK